MKVVTVVGARPQFIKAAMVSRSLEAAAITEVMIHTGQHYDHGMSAVFFTELGMAEPACNLGIGSGPHGAQTGRMLEALEDVLAGEQPDRVVVYGDTNSTLAGALAAAKLHLPLAHVEAGLRSFNRSMPEEINRIATDAISDLLLAPTRSAAVQLQKEGIPDARIRITGDVMYDATLHFRDQAIRQSAILTELGLGSQPFVLATIHRAENTDVPDRLAAILAGLNVVAAELPVIWPIHPRSREALGERDPGAVRLVEPVGYFDMLRLEAAAAVIATDSGGVQKEAFFHRVPCVTVRTETEWTELVDLGWNRIVPPESGPAIARAILAAIGSHGREGAPFGDGDAAGSIVRALLE
ncbi:MAG: UDP-N-acetylglucosamine 2-epimerase (non-hydrolyzing) [Dehalococcoidia bacterium]